MRFRNEDFRLFHVLRLVEDGNGSSRDGRRRFDGFRRECGDHELFVECDLALAYVSRMTHNQPDHRVVQSFILLIPRRLDHLEQMIDKSVVELSQLFRRKLLNTADLIHEVGRGETQARFDWGKTENKSLMSVPPKSITHLVALGPYNLAESRQEFLPPPVRPKQAGMTMTIVPYDVV